tara:strand:- start:42 stop:173 length:132 start_codon:yes stop_codon:yes gene_type:complete
MNKENKVINKAIEIAGAGSELAKALESLKTNNSEYYEQQTFEI